MNQYLQEAFMEMQKRMAESGAKPLTPDQFQNIVKPEDLQAFMDQMQAQALTGDKNAARQMLSQLQNMTDMMDPANAGEMPKDMQFMNNAHGL